MSSKVVFGALLVLATRLPAGHPSGQYEHATELREARTNMMRFQNALAAERWPEALSLCSDRVRQKASAWPSVAAFFRETMPVEKVANAVPFTFCKEGHGKDFHLYGSFVQLTDRDSKPVTQWEWSVQTTTNKTWVIDYEPKPIVLEELIAKQKAESQKRHDRFMRIRGEVEPKLRRVKTHLTAVSEQFAIGAPMLFRLELINFDDSPVEYLFTNQPLIVTNEKREQLPFEIVPSQVPVHPWELAAGATFVLADNIDLARNYEIRKPGRYFVQFSGDSLGFGKRLRDDTDGLGTWLDFVSVPGKLPSNVLQIEVKKALE